jgi:hypothetical protein
MWKSKIASIPSMWATWLLWSPDIQERVPRDSSWGVCRMVQAEHCPREFLLKAMAGC